MSLPTRLRPLALGLLMAALAAPLGLQAQSAGGPAATGTNASAEPVGRVIVRFKANAQSVRAQALSARTDVATARQIARVRAEGLGGRTGLALRAHHSLDERTQVVLAKGLSSEALAARLGKDAEVELVAVDQRRHATAVPNDPLYPQVNQAQGSNGHGQWYLMPPSKDLVSSINAEGAWDLSTGSSSVVVAVLDTGVRYDHPDLAGKLLPGYDMIGASTNDVDALAVANDGNRGDSDASDPGDWVSDADIASGLISGCTYDDVGNSSWHGTKVSGLIGAASNNGVGIAGVSWGSRILPVRVLGKCGGYDSDIMLGMRWAAGITAPGVPANPTPARVLNMSLGGSGSCSDGSSLAKLYTETVAEVRAKGAVIVAAAGNSAGQAVGLPANCSGVIAVGGLRHVGTKTGFSSVGPEVTLSAPGGNCVLAEGPCLYPMLTTSNPGKQGPEAAVNAYTNNEVTIGTSFSAPLVSGSVALLLSVRPDLTPDQVRQTLVSTVRPFPTTGGGSSDDASPAACKAPDGTRQYECYCTTSTCGAGMLDVQAALKSVAPTPSSSGGSGGGGGGAMSPAWLLALLASVPLLRRARRSR